MLTTATWILQHLHIIEFFIPSSVFNFFIMSSTSSSTLSSSYCVPNIEFFILSSSHRVPHIVLFITNSTYCALHNEFRTELFISSSILSSSYWNSSTHTQIVLVHLICPCVMPPMWSWIIKTQMHLGIQKHQTEMRSWCRSLQLDWLLHPILCCMEWVYHMMCSNIDWNVSVFECLRSSGKLCKNANVFIPRIWFVNSAVKYINVQRTSTEKSMTNNRVIFFPAPSLLPA